MCNIHQLKKRFYTELKDIYPDTEIKSFFYLLASHQLKLNRAELAINSIQLSEEDVTFFNNSLQQLRQEKPIQYIIGHTEFYGLPIDVNDYVLIPRPETEELVEWILKEITSIKKPKIIDIGTGSGCIAISVAKHKANATVTGIDISEKAIAVATQNAIKNDVTVHFKKIDILKESSSIKDSYDCIVSNPPYIRELEKQEIQNNVLSYEPHTALFVSNDDPLLFYRYIADFAKTNLTPNGKLFFEINQYLGKETCEMLHLKGFSTELRKDFYGNDRMICAVVS